jgi:hypothetical protein
MRALGKSKRSIGTYIEELQTHQICKVVPAKNQYGRTMFEIADATGPTSVTTRARHRPIHKPTYNPFETTSSRSAAYREPSAPPTNTSPSAFMSAPFLWGVIENAMLLGVCRKYICWLNQQSRQPIQTLRYFEPLIAEVQAQPLPPGYAAAYLRQKIQQLSPIC